MIKPVIHFMNILDVRWIIHELKPLKGGQIGLAPVG